MAFLSLQMANVIILYVGSDCLYYGHSKYNTPVSLNLTLVVKLKITAMSIKKLGSLDKDPFFLLQKQQLTYLPRTRNNTDIISSFVCSRIRNMLLA